MNDFNQVCMIVPSTNLNINDILKLESSRALPDKLQINIQAATELQRTGHQRAKTVLNTHLRLVASRALATNTGTLNLCSRAQIGY